jgi:hypothetical protein
MWQWQEVGGLTGVGACLKKVGDAVAINAGVGFQARVALAVVQM